MPPIPAEVTRAARDAHRHAADLTTEALSRYPDAWRHMDMLRTSTTTGATWPDWCLLPMAGAVAAVTGGGPITGPVLHVAQIAALYAWRYTKSVYIIEPGLQARLMAQIPDAVDLTTLAGLPEWCCYVAGTDVEWPGAGVWIHLEHDINTGRPELRMLLDPGGRLDDMVAIPVYLDRETVTEALADMRATALATYTGSGPVTAGANVRGGDLDATIATIADRVDAYLAVAIYLARSEADIVRVDRPGPGPARYRSPARDKTVWAVGYSA